MKKIRLDLDMLSVETFSTTGGAAEARGTVNAHRPIYTEGWDCESIDVCETVDCPGTAATDCGTCYDASCAGTYCGTCQPTDECASCEPYVCCTGFDCW